MKILRLFRITVQSAAVDSQQVFADLTPEERDRCRNFWFRFRLLERVGFTLLIIPAIARWLLPRFSSRFPAWFWTACIATSIASWVSLYNLDCPRCSAKFSGGLIALLGSRWLWKCYGCDLRREDVKYISEHASDLN